MHTLLLLVIPSNNFYLVIVMLEIRALIRTLEMQLDLVVSNFVIDYLLKLYLRFNFIETDTPQ